MRPINEGAREDFESQYEASIVLSDRRHRRVKRTTITEAHQWFSQNEVSDYWNNQVEDVEMIEICLPRERLPALLESQEAFLFAREREERAIREEYPSVKQAWDQYQLMLALVK